MKDYLVKGIAQNKQVPTSVAVGLPVITDFTIKAAGFYYSADVSTEEETICFINVVY